MTEYKKRRGDRKDGRLLRSLPPFNKITPFIMPHRNDASNLYEETFEVSAIDAKIKDWRSAGYSGIGLLHVLIAAYIKGIAAYPGINRFIAGHRIYARNDITVIMVVKRTLTLNSPETSIKVVFKPTDTVFDVYNKMNEKIEEVRNVADGSDAEDLAGKLCKAPRPLLRLAISFLKWMDYHGVMPKSVLDVSPFHGSMIITNLGSLGIGPIYHHIYNFGTLPVFIAFGSRYKAVEFNKKGTPVGRHYVDCKFVMDERTVDGHYYATFLKKMRRVILDPVQLELPPDEVKEDVE